MTVLGTTLHTARKQHRCNYCGYIIEPKQNYFKTAIVDGDFWVWKSHKYCTELVDRIDMFKYLEPGEGLTQDDFVEHIFQIYNKLSEESDRISSFRQKLDFLIKHYELCEI